MTNQLGCLLEQWYAAKDEMAWVLATVYKTEGSAYRKAGAMMLINDLGQQFGLLSGGCLESDIVRNARKIINSNRALTLVYDGSDEDDLSFQLGIGCGGKIYIMLQALTPDNDLGLSALRAALRNRQSGNYYQKICSNDAYFTLEDSRPASVIENDWFISPIVPEPHILVIGGGVDARPVVALAKGLGWRVTVADPRPANARVEYFRSADKIIRLLDENLSRYALAQRVDGAIIMSHNIKLDALGLRLLQSVRLRYTALLGPKHRYHQVLDCAQLTTQELTCPVSAPAGLAIGGQLPESIALAILAECHQAIHQSQEGQRVP